MRQLSFNRALAIDDDRPTLVDRFCRASTSSGEVGERSTITDRLPADDRSYSLQVNAQFAVNFRLVPITRAGLVSDEMLDNERYFPFTAMSAEIETADIRADANLPLPVFRVEASAAAATLHFASASSATRLAQIDLRYEPVGVKHAPLYTAVYELDDRNNTSNSATISLHENLGESRVYQICARYKSLVSSSAPSHVGFWHCLHVLLNNRSSVAIDERPAATPLSSSLPSVRVASMSVDCQRQNCRCQQAARHAAEDVEVRWRASSARSSLHYALRATLAEPMLDEVAGDAAISLRQRFGGGGGGVGARGFCSSVRRTADGDVAIDVRGLFASLRYRFAIEARDERGESATISGTFECQAPSALHVPPPTSVRIALEHERLVHVVWRPPLPLGYLRSKRAKPPFSGYVIVFVRSLSLSFIKKRCVL